MEFNQQLQPPRERATISRDEMRRRMLEYINTELNPDDNPDSDYPEDDDILQTILEVAVTQNEIEELVSDFVISQLHLFPEDRRERAVEVFAAAIPGHLTIDFQADLGAIFEAALRQAALPPSWVDTFFDSLLEAVELSTPGSQSEFEPVPMDLEDVFVPPPRVFPWLEPSTIIVRDPLPPIVPFHGPQVENSAILNEIDDLTVDLNNLRVALMDLHVQLSLMVDDIGASYDPLRATAQRLLQENANDLNMVLLPDSHDVTPDDVSIIAGGLSNAEGILGTVKEKTFLAEMYLVTQEDILLATGGKVKAYASRYERSRYRSHLMWLISSFRTPRLRQVFIPSGPQPEPTVRKYDATEPTCPICMEDLPEEGEICAPAAVSFACCNKGFHTDCLLGCMIEKIGDGAVPCPMCRMPFDLSFFGEILEQKVRELQVL